MPNTCPIPHGSTIHSFSFYIHIHIRICSKNMFWAVFQAEQDMLRHASHVGISHCILHCNLTKIMID